MVLSLSASTLGHINRHALLPFLEWRRS
jgi:hypothetical protein